MSARSIIDGQYSEYSVDDDDEFIAKIKAAAKKGQKLKSSSIKELIPSIATATTASVVSPAEGEEHSDGSFFCHAVSVLKKNDLSMFLKEERLRSKNVKAEVEMQDEKEEPQVCPNSNHAPPSIEKATITVSESADIEAPVRVEEDANEISMVDEDDAPTESNIRPTIIRDTAIRVKVDGKLQKFVIKADDNFETVFKALAQSMRLSINEFSLLRDVDYIRPSDTPRQLDFDIVEILECVRHSSCQSGLPATSTRQLANDKNCIKLKFQDAEKKGMVEIIVNKLDSFEIIKEKYLKERGLKENAPKSAKFVFDGYAIPASSTPEDLDMDDGDCIDVMQ